MSNAGYTWSVNCTDVNNITNSSATYSLTVSYSSGGGGGGGGGGSSQTEPETNETENETIEEITPPAVPIQTCTESWSCSDWYECVEGKQARTCVDANNCGTSYNKPIETRECTVEKPVIQTEYKFTLEIGGTYTFSYKGQEHSLVLNEIIGFNMIKFTVYSEPRTFTLTQTGLVELDLDEDEVKDIRISFEGTDGFKADIKITLLEAARSAGLSGAAVVGKEIELTPESGPDPYYMVPVFLLIILFVAVISLRKAKLSKKIRKIVTIFHISLLVLIIILFATAFLTKSDITGMAIADTTAGNLVEYARVPLFVIVGIAIAASLILIYIHHKRNLKQEPKIKQKHHKKPKKPVHKVEHKHKINKHEILNKLKRAHKL
jgi:hypothetical protein